MKSFIKSIFGTFLLALIVMSCNKEQTLQEYIVESKENNEYMSIDLPASIIHLEKTSITEEDKATLATIKKMNFLAFRLSDTNKEMYAAEKLKVKKILKQEAFTELMSVKGKIGDIMVSFVGSDEAIDEVIIFGSSDDKGFALARVLGENMNPADILKIAQHLKFDDDSGNMNQLGALFATIN